MSHHDHTTQGAEVAADLGVVALANVIHAVADVPWLPVITMLLTFARPYFDEWRLARRVAVRQLAENLELKAEVARLSALVAPSPTPEAQS